jgi:pimeloyl-ACP methyl ester carboxylesterase
MVLGSSAASACLLFVPGFMVSPSAYTALLAPASDRLGRVVVPAPEASTVAMLAGRYSATEQAEHLVGIAHQLQRDGTVVTLGGHSRGGLVAYLAAQEVLPAALVLIDPVSGDGGPRAVPEPLPVARFEGRSLVLGCGIGDRCAPVGRNHEVFAAALPGCRHTVLPECGHADMLDGNAARLGRRLCEGGPDPERARATVAAAILDAIV